MNSRKLACLVWLLLSTGGLILGQSQDAESLIRQNFENNVLLMRGFPSDSHIVLDELGHALHPLHAGPWTLAFFKIHKVRVKDGHIQLVGNRVGLRYDNNARMLKKVRTPESITISIEMPITELSEKKVKELRNSLFIEEQLAPVVPNYWRDYIAGNIKTRKEKNGKITYLFPTQNEDEVANVQWKREDGEPIYKAKKGVEPPKPVFSPDPKYTDTARQLGVTGTVTLLALVEKTGEIREVKIVQPLGLGLDDQAVDAVNTWRFKPALYNGTPVAFAITVEVDFEGHR